MELSKRLRFRERLAKARMYCERQALASLGSRRLKSTGRLLCYHSIGQPDLGVNDCSPTRLRGHIELAIRRGFRFVPAAQIARGDGSSYDLSITFDDGWKSVLTVAAPLLSEYQIPWTLFVTTGLIESSSEWHRSRMLEWSELAGLSKMGVEIGSHSITHPDFGTIDQHTAMQELSISRMTLRGEVGCRD